MSPIIKDVHKASVRTDPASSKRSKVKLGWLLRSANGVCRMSHDMWRSPTLLMDMKRHFLLRLHEILLFQVLLTVRLPDRSSTRVKQQFRVALPTHPHAVARLGLTWTDDSLDHDHLTAWLLLTLLPLWCMPSCHLDQSKIFGIHRSGSPFVPGLTGDAPTIMKGQSGTEPHSR